MKHLILSAVATVVVLVAGCEKNTSKEMNRSLAGTWKEFQYLADPGDGSGTWQNGNGLTLTINEDLTYSTDKDFSFWGNSGKITLLSDSTFTINRPLSGADLPLNFKLKDGVLEVHYLCIEPCGSRFRKIDAGN